MDWNNTDLEKLAPGTTPQLGLDAYEFEKAYNEKGIAYSHEFALFVKLTNELSVKLGRTISILEVGVGTGRVGAFLHQLPWIDDYLGIDTEPSAIEMCKHRHPKLSVRQQNIFHVKPSERWDVVIIPFGTFSGFNQDWQASLLYKMVHHSTSMVIIDTLLPEAFGSTEDILYKNNGQELGLSIDYIDWFASWRTYTQWIVDYNSHNKQKISGRYIEYPFLYQEKERQDHQLVIIEKH